MFSRRIRDQYGESGRLYKWRFAFQLVLAYLSFSLGMRPIVTIEGPYDSSIQYKGAFFLAHAVIMVAVGLPLSYLLVVIGQFSGSGALQVWKMVPAARGIGLAVVVTMLINAVTNGVTVAYALYYLIFVLQSVSKQSRHTCGIFRFMVSKVLKYPRFSMESMTKSIYLKYSNSRLFPWGLLDFTCFL